MLYKHSRRIRVVFFKNLYETPSGILINGSILKELFADDLGVFEACRRNKFYINLYALSRIIHLFVRLWNIFRIWRMNCHNSLLTEKSVYSRDGTGVTTLLEFNPKDNKTGIGIASAHIKDQLDLFRGMLVWMGLRERSRRDSIEPS